MGKFRDNLNKETAKQVEEGTTFRYFITGCGVLIATGVAGYLLGRHHDNHQ